MPDVYVSDPANEAEAPKTEAPITEPPKTDTSGPTKEVLDARALIKDILKRAGEEPRKELGGAYTVFPGGNFIDKQSDEEVVLVLRAHPITNLGWILLVILALLLPEMMVAIGALSSFPFKAIFVGRLVWYLMMLGFSFEKFLDWYYSVFIVTNERIIDIDFLNLLYRVMSYATLNHIEEPAMVAGGFFRSFFHYGDIYVATAAENPTLEASNIPHPDKVVRIISELSEELEKRRERGE